MRNLRGVDERVVLIGQAPSRTSDPARPLSGSPLAARLAALLGTSVDEYMGAFDRRNLLPVWPGKNGKGDAFPPEEAGRAAEDAIPDLFGRRVVFLGRGVAAAFGLPYRVPFLFWVAHRGMTAACLPHPSGVNLWWNDERHVRAARRFLRAAARAAGHRVRP